MTLKDIFTMVKADRYTADGREEVIKAREAETEDARQPKGIYHWKSGDYRKEGDKYVKIGPGTGGAGPLNPAKKKAARVEQIQKASGKEAHTERTKARAESKPVDFSTKEPNAIYKEMTGQQTTSAEENEMDKISAFMQEETGATLRNAIVARESFYKNLKSPTPEQQQGLAALMSIEKKLGYGNQKETGATGKTKTLNYKEMGEGPLYGKAESKPAGNKPAETEPEDKSEIRISSYMDKNFAGKPNSERNAFYDFVKKKIYKSGKDPQQYLGQGGYSYPNKLLNEYLKEWQAKDEAPRVLTGDTRIRVRKA